LTSKIKTATRKKLRSEPVKQVKLENNDESDDLLKVTTETRNRKVKILLIILSVIRMCKNCKIIRYDIEYIQCRVLNSKSWDEPFVKLWLDGIRGINFVKFKTDPESNQRKLESTLPEYPLTENTFNVANKMIRALPGYHGGFATMIQAVLKPKTTSVTLTPSNTDNSESSAKNKTNKSNKNNTAKKNSKPKKEKNTTTTSKKKNKIPSKKRKRTSGKEPKNKLKKKRKTE
jgi:hypothetical protein